METLFIESKHDKTLLQVYLSSLQTKKQKAEAPGIIIAHPYGPLGGNMNNNVVISIQRYFLSIGYITACINFRGCGKSQGKTSWTGIAERNDYISVMEYLLLLNNDKYPKLNGIILCGYSYGAMIANSIQFNTLLPCTYLLISMPIGVIWALATTKSSLFKQRQPTAEVISIHGDQDQFTSLTSFKNWAINYENITDICIQGIDHFWLNHEDVLIEQIKKIL